MCLFESKITTTKQCLIGSNSSCAPPDSVCTISEWETIPCLYSQTALAYDDIDDVCLLSGRSNQPNPLFVGRSVTGEPLVVSPHPPLAVHVYPNPNPNPNSNPHNADPGYITSMVMVAPRAARLAGHHMLVNHTTRGLCALSSRYEICAVEERTATPYLRLVSATNTRGDIAEHRTGGRTIQLGRIAYPDAICDSATHVKCVGPGLCSHATYRPPRVLHTVSVYSHSWRQVVAIAYDSQDKLYALDVFNNCMRLFIRNVDECRCDRRCDRLTWDSGDCVCHRSANDGGWRVVAAFKWPHVMNDAPFTVCVAAFRQRAYIAHDIHVRVLHYSHSYAPPIENTRQIQIHRCVETALLVGRPSPQTFFQSDCTEAHRLTTNFIRHCILVTRTPDQKLDIEPFVCAIRSATGPRQHSSPWPPGIANIVEEYARGFGMPAASILVLGAHTVRRFAFTG